MIRWVLTIFLALVIFSSLLPWLEKLGIGRLPGDVRIIGSYLADYHVGLSKQLPPAPGLPQRAALLAWGGGVRKPRGAMSETGEDGDLLTPDMRGDVDIMSVRGPLSASELALGDDFQRASFGDAGVALVRILVRDGARTDDGAGAQVARLGGVRDQVAKTEHHVDTGIRLADLRAIPRDAQGQMQLAVLPGIAQFIRRHRHW